MGGSTYFPPWDGGNLRYKRRQPKEPSITIEELQEQERQLLAHEMQLIPRGVTIRKVVIDGHEGYIVERHYEFR